MMNKHTLTELSPLDGRYAQSVEALRPLFSEAGLIKHRFTIEVRWLQHLIQHNIIHGVTDEAVSDLQGLLKGFSLDDAIAVRETEKTTLHDVKAIEYTLKNLCLNTPSLANLVQWIHFACTSEDINNLAYGLMLKSALHDVMLPEMQAILDWLHTQAVSNAEQPMLSRTHGQTASPTTLGKEFAVFKYRLGRQLAQLAELDITGKFNGAVGNFSAHSVAFPDLDWPSISASFIQSLGLTSNPLTTQIEPHDNLAEVCHNLMRFNAITIDLARDIWGYISLGYFSQEVQQGQVGSSTMPHKINPIDFENAEGNLGMANAVLSHLADKLPISRWQRDLSDSTVLRNQGVGLGHSLLAYRNLLKGLNKLTLNSAAMAADLDNAWEVLAEPVQTVMRSHGIDDAYEQLKAISQGKPLNQDSLHQFIDQVAIPDSDKARLRAMMPSDYVGLAAQLVNLT